MGGGRRWECGLGKLGVSTELGSFPVVLESPSWQGIFHELTSAVGYTILLSVVYGAAVGWIAKELLHWAEERKFVDRESFLVFAISLALFIVGTCGMIGSDDILACFIAGNVFTWDDW
jgi:NhaP-type Na+/H+ or K+/H+ antiporter